MSEEATKKIIFATRSFGWWHFFHIILIFNELWIQRCSKCISYSEISLWPSIMKIPCWHHRATHIISSLHSSLENEINFKQFNDELSAGIITQHMLLILTYKKINIRTLLHRGLYAFVVHILIIDKPAQLQCWCALFSQYYPTGMCLQGKSLCWQSSGSQS